MWPGASPSSPLFHEKLAAWAFYSGSDFLVVSARPVVRSFIPFVAYLVPKRFRPSAAPERPVLGAQAARGRAGSGEPRPRSCLGAGRGVALPRPRPGGLGGPAWCQEDPGVVRSWRGWFSSHWMLPKVRNYCIARGKSIIWLMAPPCCARELGRPSRGARPVETVTPGCRGSRRRARGQGDGRRSPAPRSFLSGRGGAWGTV